jgi:threonine dehydratase
MLLTPPDRSDVLAASDRISGSIVRTPMLYREIGGRTVWFKAEVMQRTGSFKIRGALNFVASLDPQVRGRGVVAYSSGNHAQGVASAAAEFGIPATIVMPSDAPSIKLRNTRHLGATVVEYDRATDSREAIAAGIAQESGATILPPYDHPFTIAGQGSVGLEVVDDLTSLGVTEALIVVPASGGGLAAGIALAVDAPEGGFTVMTAEPVTHDDHRRSFVAGERVRVEPAEPSICDALLQPIPGEITFAVNGSRIAAGVAASDDEVRAAMRFAFEDLKLVVEPGGAVALAAFLQGRVPGAEPVVVVLSGGNVDPALMREVLAG